MRPVKVIEPQSRNISVHTDPDRAWYRTENNSGQCDRRVNRQTCFAIARALGEWSPEIEDEVLTQLPDLSRHPSHRGTYDKGKSPGELKRLGFQQGRYVGNEETQRKSRMSLDPTRTPAQSLDELPGPTDAELQRIEEEG
jgi:hypothetical protein